MKKILLLANNIPFQLDFYIKLEKLLDQEYKIIYSIDSHYSDYISNNYKKLTNAYYLSDYINRKNSFIKNSTWIDFFSDIDRYITLDLKNKNINYQEEYKRIYEYFKYIYEKEKIDYIIYEPVSNSYSKIAHKVSQLYGIKFLSISPSRISNRIEISEDGTLSDNILFKKQFSEYVPSENIELRNKAKKWIETIEFDTPTYMKLNKLDNINLFKKYLRLEKFKKLVNGIIYLLAQKKDYEKSYLIISPFQVHLKMFTNSIKRIIKIIFLRKLYKKIDYKDKYILYPLHFHPEASTSINASDYVDEWAVINSIAFRLPLDHVLYVKDHPSAIGTMEYMFYKKISKLPNVKLISSIENTKELIKNSIGITCVTSTVGFEAAVMKKPVIVFGNVFYEYFPNVKKLNSINEFSYSLFSINNKITNEKIIDCVQFYMNKTTEGIFDFEYLFKNELQIDKVAKYLKYYIESN